MIDAYEEMKDWLSQPNKSACLPTCLHNILLDISKNPRNIKPIEFKFQAIAKEVEYDPDLGTAPDNAVAGIRRMLAKGKFVQWYIETSEDKRHDPRKICDIAASENKSYPIVSLGPEYLVDEYGLKFEGDPFGWLDHSVVLLECNSDGMIIFDPYAPAGSGSRVRSLSKYNFQKYSLCANPRN